MIDKGVKDWAIKAHDMPRFYYYMVPQLLFYGKYRSLSSNARLLYAMIWDKLRVAELRGWIDKDGFLFVRLARKTASFKLCINSAHTIQNCFEQLEQAKLIFRVRNGKTIVDDIYPLMPDDKEASKEAYKQMKLFEEEEEGLLRDNPVLM